MLRLKPGTARVQETLDTAVKKKYNRVHFKDLIGFTEPFISQEASHPGSRKELPMALGRKGFLRQDKEVISKKTYFRHR